MLSFYCLKNRVVELIVTVARKGGENRLEAYTITYVHADFCKKKEDADIVFLQLITVAYLVPKGLPT